jgi:ABC-type glycerol-3-phosphate transport system permease component
VLDPRYAARPGGAVRRSALSHPPYYMIVTSLKSDAEVAHLATNPWIIANGITFEQYRLLFQESEMLLNR